MSRLLLTVALLASIPNAGHAAPPGAPTARLDSGYVTGTTEKGDVQAFRGIPYAAPPVGPLRWRAPAPVQAWQDVRDASQFGAACPQAPDHKESWAKVGKTSENCLFLNVWRPARPGKYPVMVFLHGGGFTYGSGGVPLYDSARLASRGVVVVTVNYRLGILGFFAHPALTHDAPDGLLGNYGIMDQVEALRWVQRNAAAIGGDPDNVTLFGESAGAGTIQLLMGSPLAKGLFHKAISQSGAGMTILPSLAAAETMGNSLTDKAGLKQVTAQQLRSLPVDKLLIRSMPVIDGKLVVASPGTAFFKKREMKIPLLIGVNSNEATLYPNSEPAVRKELGDRYDPILASYAGLGVQDAKTELAEDAMMLLPSFTIGQLHAAAGAPAWIYYFDQSPSNRRKGSAGTGHGGEMEYLFGNPDEGSVWDEADQKVSDQFADYWVRFARTGNPATKAQPWSPVQGTPLRYLHMGTPMKEAVLEAPREDFRQSLVTQVAPKWGAEQ